MAAGRGQVACTLDNYYALRLGRAGPRYGARRRGRRSVGAGGWGRGARGVHMKCGPVAWRQPSAFFPPETICSCRLVSCSPLTLWPLLSNPFPSPDSCLLFPSLYLSLGHIYPFHFLSLQDDQIMQVRAWACCLLGWASVLIVFSRDGMGGGQIVSVIWLLGFANCAPDKSDEKTR
jgi:hypothetical protein